MKDELEMIKKGDIVLIGDKFGLVLSDVKCKTINLEDKNLNWLKKSIMYVIPISVLNIQAISVGEIPKHAKVWKIDCRSEFKSVVEEKIP